MAQGKLKKLPRVTARSADTSLSDSMSLCSASCCNTAYHPIQESHGF